MLEEHSMLEEHIRSARFVIADDEIANVALLTQTLERWGCLNLAGTTDPRDILALCTQMSPDIILLDLMMPHLDGFQVMEQLKSVVPPGVFLPILVLTADITPEAKRRALASGAHDFLTKPFDPTELLLRIRNLLTTRLLNRQLQDQNQILDRKVRERTHDLEVSRRDLDESQIEILERLAKAGEYRDDDTGRHTYRVGLASTLLAQSLGLPEESVELVRRAAPLHDVGKIGISDLILLKPGRLTPEEFGIIKSHTTIGAALLSGGHSDLVQLAESIALTHHERFDGSGYPRGMAGEAIPIEGRIVAIVDVFDALTHARPYKEAWPIEDAVAEITRQSGKQFCPTVAEAFFTLPHQALV